MAGHSKWANIKRKKGANDAKRGKLFTKLIREVTVASKLGGPNPDHNPRLRDAVIEARSNNIAKDTIERAIKKGTGGGDGEAALEQITYEGYGPSGVAILIESLTDNRNRTVGEVRFSMTKYGGNLGESGSVSWMFKKKGVITVRKEVASEEKVMEAALETGAEDVRDEGEVWEVLTDPNQLSQVREVFEKLGITFENATVSAIPDTTVHLSGDAALKMLKLMDALEDLDDVQRVHANFDIDEKELEQLGALG